MSSKYTQLGKALSAFQSEQQAGFIGFWRAKVVHASPTAVEVYCDRLKRTFFCEQLPVAVKEGDGVLLGSFEGREDMMEIVRKTTGADVSTAPVTTPASGNPGVQVPAPANPSGNTGTPVVTPTPVPSGNTGTPVPSNSSSGPAPATGQQPAPTSDLWPDPTGWREVIRKDFTTTGDLTDLGIYGDYGSTAGAGTWLKQNVRIGTDKNGKRALVNVGYVLNGAFFGGAYAWGGAAAAFGGRWEWDGLFEAGAGFAGVPFMLWPSQDEVWPTAGEVDVLELGDGGRTDPGSNFHKDTKRGSTRFDGFHLSTAARPIRADERHVWAIEWFPGKSLETFCDGVSVAKETDVSFVPNELPMHIVSQQDFIGMNAATAAKGNVQIVCYRMRYLKKI